MNSDLMQHPTVEEWARKYPQEWWALSQLHPKDKMRDRVLLAVLQGDEDAEAIDDLVRYAEGHDTFARAKKNGTLSSPPAVGERRPMSLVIKRMKKVTSGSGDLCFCVEFASSGGWSGHFKTKNPAVVERIAKHRHKHKPLTVVGEVVARFYEFLVVLDGHVKIV